MNRLLVGVIGIAASLLVARSWGQTPPPPEFGVRFPSQSFAPVTFRGFGFGASPSQPRTASPIQFRPINFPALTSAAVRRQFLDRAEEEDDGRTLRLYRRSTASPTDPLATGRARFAPRDVARGERGFARRPNDARARVADALTTPRVVRGLSPSRMAVLQEDPSARSVVAANPDSPRRTVALSPRLRTVVAPNPARTAALERPLR